MTPRRRAPQPLLRRSGLCTRIALCLVSWSLGPGGVHAEVSDPSGDPTTPPADDGFFRSPNDEVAEGNARMAQDDPAGALAAYDAAAKALPNAAGVHLNRGLALLATGDVAKSRSALQLATQPPADRPTRSAAYYNLGNSFFLEADALAGEDQHQQAQARFREAVTAYTQALRLQPDLEDAAWNLELAQRRVQEEQEKAEEQQQEQDEQQQDGDPQNQGDQQPQNGDPQNQDPNQDPNKPEPQKGEDGDQGQDPQKPDEPQDPSKDGQQDDADAPPPEQAQQPAPVPSEVDRALDALQDNEENLERYRAQQRARRERRRPEKDW